MEENSPAVICPVSQEEIKEESRVLISTGHQFDGGFSEGQIFKALEHKHPLSREELGEREKGYLNERQQVITRPDLKIPEIPYPHRLPPPAPPSLKTYIRKGALIGAHIGLAIGCVLGVCVGVAATLFSSVSLLAPMIILSVVMGCCGFIVGATVGLLAGALVGGLIGGAVCACAKIKYCFSKKSSATPAEPSPQAATKAKRFFSCLAKPKTEIVSEEKPVLQDEKRSEATYDKLSPRFISREEKSLDDLRQPLLPKEEKMAIQLATRNSYRMSFLDRVAKQAAEAKAAAKKAKLDVVIDVERKVLVIDSIRVATVRERHYDYP